MPFPVAETQAMLLKKIEELTLYIIAKEKKLRQLELDLLAIKNSETK